MPRSVSYSFNDPLAYQGAIRGGQLEVLLATRGDFRAKLQQIDCNRLWMQHGCENLAGVKHAAFNLDRAVVLFLADPLQPCPRVCGVELSAQALTYSGLGSAYHLRTNGPFRWAAMSLPADDFAARSVALTGREMRAGPATRTLHPDPQHMARLARLHRATRQLAQTAPDVFLRPEVCNALEHELVHAMVTCLADDDELEPRSGWRHHSLIIRKFEEFLAENCDRPLHLAEICAAVRASERVLRICCEEHLGMGPIRYLWLRRMHLARRALISADPAKTTVTEVATHFGFWELGRFATSYRALFGQSPSVCLHARATGSRAVQRKRPTTLADASTA
jgi:AraC-like DNA-binding protein